MARFLTSARAVDMLGRQQIAGIPTAISELFKNAYDAYATSVRADYFPDRRALLLRDNGIGMSEEDFQRRWLTVGTDSKAEGGLLERPSRPRAMSERRQMGEKGIGRLAIASIGPQLLVVTRAASEDAGVVVALVQWSIFETPGLTLDEVVVPIRTIDSINGLGAPVVESMIAEILMSVRALDERISPDRVAQIERELRFFPDDVRPYLALTGPKLAESSGTAFLVCPVREELDNALSVPDRKEEIAISPFQRFLSGFTNTMTPGLSRGELSTQFFVHDERTVTDLIDPEMFWQPEDFGHTDHTIEGEFDEYGAFHGFASIYGAPAIPFVEPWTKGRGQLTKCGTFRLKFGYVQGDPSDSKLSAEDWALMTSRLHRLGGLYVYRDGIRVLPYGNSDVDYLGIEQRRTLKASKYFFSYRRMFGAIDVSSASNPNLQEKAGREGFRENGAYDDFKDILKNLLIQTAATFFSAEGEQGSAWTAERERLKQRASARSARETRERRARDRFAKQLEEALSYIESGSIKVDIDNELSATERVLKALPVDADAEAIAAAEAEGRRELARIADRFLLHRPAGLALTSALERDWIAYERLAGGASNLVRKGLARLTAIVNRSVKRSGGEGAMTRIEASRRGRIEERGAATIKEVKTLGDQAERTATRFVDRVNDLVEAEVSAHEAQVHVILAELESAIQLADDATYLDRIQTYAQQHLDYLNGLNARLLAYVDGGLDTDDGRVLQEQVLDLQDQLDTNLELMQLGQAVQIVSHEFESSIGAVRTGLQELAPWARSTPRLAPVVRDLRASFAHLDGYLKLFTPLQRRLHRQAVVITGNEIADFVDRVFGERLLRHDVKLEVTDLFRSWRIHGYPSTFYPVFVNLVDNSIHWTSHDTQADGRIILDADDKSLYVRDNGPGVALRDRDAIFERGFSRRRGGRGLGLSLASEILEREGWVLTYDETWQQGASFRIQRAQIN